MPLYKIYIDTFELISTSDDTKPFDRVTDLDVFVAYKHGRSGDLVDREKAMPLIAFQSFNLEDAAKEMYWNALHYPLTSQNFDGRHYYLRGRLCWLEDEDGNVIDYAAAPYV